MNAARYLWAHPYGPTAVMILAIGLTGLTVHYWTALPLVAVLPRTIFTGSYQARHRSTTRGNHRMTRGKARS